MTPIRFVVLSDLHFGAENSLMTSVVEHPPGAPSAAAAGAAGPEPYEPAPNTPSPVLVAVTDALRTLVERQDDPPTLILAGDVLDLALSSDAVAATAFEGFVDAAFGQTPRLFADTVYYLPGNHDHHLWESAREGQYVNYLEDLGPGAPIGEPWHVTGLLPSSLRPTHGGLLQALIRRRPGGEDVTVLVAYPNLALVTPDGRRCRVVSHGHFSEPIYILMSQLRDLLFPEQRDPAGLSIAADGSRELRLDRLLLVHARTLRRGRQRRRPGVRRPEQRSRPGRAVRQPGPQPGCEEPRAALAATGRIGDPHGDHQAGGEPPGPQRAGHPGPDAQRQERVRAAPLPGRARFAAR